ncbi:MAG: hypothetical protein ACRC8B_19960 [Aeromonas sobria]|uniref:hypothetical protein n=1 Tax=Aeromonas sobria TaxID=646 RepID=UPI003F36005A
MSHFQLAPGRRHCQGGRDTLPPHQLLATETEENMGQLWRFILPPHQPLAIEKHDAIYGNLHCRLIISSWQQEIT